MLLLLFLLTTMRWAFWINCPVYQGNISPSRFPVLPKDKPL